MVRGQPWNPARHAGAEVFVFFPEFPLQRRLFVKNNEGEKTQPNNGSVRQQADTAEKETLAEKQQ